jgi:hypothetical protein
MKKQGKAVDSFPKRSRAREIGYPHVLSGEVENIRKKVEKIVAEGQICFIR